MFVVVRTMLERTIEYKICTLLSLVPHSNTHIETEGKGKGDSLFSTLDGYENALIFAVI